MGVLNWNKTNFCDPGWLQNTFILRTSSLPSTTGQYVTKSSEVIDSI